MTDYKSMFEQAVRTLAAIDEALGIGDDGCGEPDRTLTAIAELKDASQRGEALARVVMADQTAHDTCAEPVAWMFEYDGMIHNKFNPPVFSLARKSTQEPWNETPLYTLEGIKE